MPSFEDLILKKGQRIKEEWYHRLVRHLNELQAGIATASVVDYYGYAHSDIVPDQDLMLNLGRPGLRWLEVHAGYGYFAKVFAGGKELTMWEGGYVYKDIIPVPDGALDLGKPDSEFLNVWAKEGHFSDKLFVAGKEVVPSAGGVWEGGYVYEDLIPYPDLALNCGLSNYRWLEVHGGYGYFEYDLTVGGKRVLKDGDPININDIYEPAKGGITEAINASYVYDELKDIDDKLLDLLDSLKPYLVALQADYQAPDMADIFADDIVLNAKGRVRVKLVADANAYAYLAWTPSGSAVEVLGMLNAGNPIPANSWHEFDFTVNEGDKVNVKVSPGARVTVALYHIKGT